MSKDDLKKNYRRTDPPSSKKAIEEHEKSGRRETHLIMSLKYVCARPGHTTRELGGGDDWLMNVLRRRLPELEEANLVRSTQTGNEDKRWYPVEPEDDEEDGA